MSAADRVALILGRAIMRAEALAVELEQLRAEQADEKPDEPAEQPKT